MKYIMTLLIAGQSLVYAAASSSSDDYQPTQAILISLPGHASVYSHYKEVDGGLLSGSDESQHAKTGHAVHVLVEGLTQKQRDQIHVLAREKKTQREVDAYFGAYMELLPLDSLAQEAFGQLKQPKISAIESTVNIYPKGHQRKQACSSPRLRHSGGAEEPAAEPSKSSYSAHDACIIFAGSFNVMIGSHNGGAKKGLAEFFARANVKEVVRRKEYPFLQIMFRKEFSIPAALIIAKDREA